MENSMNSIMSKSRSKSFSPSERSRTTIDHSPEESSWTMYFEDCFANGNDNISHFSSDINYQSSSLVSDAASSVARNFAFSKEALDGMDTYLGKGRNRLSFKKRKTKATLVDDDLKDTASSPANSPKVCNLKSHFEKNTKQNDEMHVSSLEKGCTSAGHKKIDGTLEELGIDGRDRDNTDELKRRGLCLVPVSVVLNYLG